MTVKRLAKTNRLRSPEFFNRILIVVVIVFLGLGLYFILRTKASTFPTTRDKYEWPFSRYSIWNMPIGDGAELVPAGFKVTDLFHPGWENADNIFLGDNSIIAEDDIVSLNPNDPVKSTPGGSAHIRPDISHDGGDWNGCAAFLSADDKNSIVQGQVLGLSPGGNASWQYDYTNVENGGRASLTGMGIGGCHGGSGMSGLGGTIRGGELTGDQPIRHALKMVIWCYLYCSPTNEGKRWPATRADSYAYDRSAGWGFHIEATGEDAFWPGYYNGPNPELRMGSLVALKKEEDLSWIQDARVRKIAEALKNYGAYIVDDTVGDRYHIAMDQDAIAEFEAESIRPEKVRWPIGSEAFRTELVTVITKLHVVTNNGPNSIGGGGNPRVCLAPQFSNGTDSISTNPNGSVTEPTANCDGVTGPTATPNPPTPTPTTSNPTPTPTPTGPTPTPSPNGNPADINGSGRVDVTDLSILIRNYKKTNATKAEGDVNGDGEVSITDLSILVKAWGT